MVTWANFHYLDFVLNWVEHVHALGIRTYLVGAMDDRILQVRFPRILCQGVIPAVALGTPLALVAWSCMAS
jgi:hypothetical protein